MAKILTTKGSSAALEDILLKAEKEVILISFNFIISQSFLKIIKRSIDKGVKIRMVYGKYIKMEDETAFNALPNLQILHYPNLHAKIFANETKCIIGSMNFSEASEMNNTELGVLLTSSADGKTFEEAIEHSKFIVGDAKIEHPMLPKEIHDKHLSSKQSETKMFKPNTSDFGHGFCIRTGEKIPLNHLKPLSDNAYSVWAEYNEHHYPEHFCHFTGEHSNGETSYAMPILQKNWKKYVKITGFNVL